MKAKGSTVIMVTHDFHQAVETCDRVIIFKNGKLVEDMSNVSNNLEVVTAKYAEQVTSL